MFGEQIFTQLRTGFRHLLAGFTQITVVPETRNPTVVRPS